VVVVVGRVLLLGSCGTSQALAQARHWHKPGTGSVCALQDTSAWLVPPKPQHPRERLNRAASRCPRLLHCSLHACAAPVHAPRAAVLSISGGITPVLAGLCLVYALDLTRFLKYGTVRHNVTTVGYDSHVLLPRAEGWSERVQQAHPTPTCVLAAVCLTSAACLPAGVGPSNPHRRLQPRPSPTSTAWRGWCRCVCWCCCALSCSELCCVWQGLSPHLLSFSLCCLLLPVTSCST
jgi:hypothetical protein